MRVELASLDIPRPPAPGIASLNCTVQLKRALNQALKSSTHSREAVAALMSDLLGMHITKAQLDAWTSESKTGHRFPFEYAAAFEAACGGSCTDLQELFCSLRGSRVLVGREALYAELGRIAELEEETLKVRKQEIRQLLRENNN